MTAAFAARDNVPGCAWQVEGDELEGLSGKTFDHYASTHRSDPAAPDWVVVIYTHIPCGEQRDSIVDMRWHLYMHMVMPVAAVGS